MCHFSALAAATDSASEDEFDQHTASTDEEGSAEETPSTDAGSAPPSLPDLDASDAERLGVRVGFAVEGADSSPSAWRFPRAARRALDVDNGHSCVVKTFRVGSKACSIEQLQVELGRVQALRHPNLISLLRFTVAPPIARLCLETTDLGSISSLLREFGLPLNGVILRRAIADSLRGLGYLHSREPAIVHGDLRCENLHLDLDLTVKLVGFGLGAALGFAPGGGAVAWAAPEVVNAQGGRRKMAPAVAAVDGEKADIWSLGCTIIEMCSGERPWGQKTTDDEIKLAMKATALGSTPGTAAAVAAASPPLPPMPLLGLQGLTRCCLRQLPAQRPSADDLLTIYLRLVLEEEPRQQQQQQQMGEAEEESELESEEE